MFSAVNSRSDKNEARRKMTLTFPYLGSAIVLGAFFPAFVNAADNVEAAIEALKEKNFAAAFEMLLPLAKAGNSEAEVQLGYLYDKGQGVPRDGQTATQWFTRAAEQGNPQGEYELAQKYEAAKGYAQALKWYRDSATLGFVASEFRIGVLYELGWGVPKDRAEGLKWIESAAEHGSAAAKRDLSFRYEHGGVGLPKDLEKAAYWKTSCANQGDVSCQYSLGKWYLQGKGVEVSYSSALQLFQQVLSSASPFEGQASAQLGLIYANGWGVPRNPAKAAEYWLAAAGKDTGAIAEFGLGNLYYSGDGVSQDYAEAARWWEKATHVVTCDPSVALLLGRLYVEGHGVPRDNVEAYKWLEIASLKGDPTAPRERESLGASLTKQEIKDAMASVETWGKSHFGSKWRQEFSYVTKNIREIKEMN